MTLVANLEVRLASEDDLPTLAKMYLRLFRHVHKTDEGTEEEKLRYAISKMRTEDHFIFLAEKEDEAVGTIAVRLLSEGVGFVYDAWVEPEHRMKSVMTELEGRVVGFLREQGFTTAELKVRTDNEEGMKTWPRMGYEPHELLMRKKI
jgi:ribosomal protein S18 acetylase RimI-like enzyme